MTDQESNALIETEGQEAKIIIDKKIADGEKLTMDDYDLCRKIRKARLK